MKIHHLRNVVVIAECGGLRAASRRLGLSQPALTRSLGELERELGTPVFERRARGMVLTRVGTSFVNRARVIINDVRRACEEVDQLVGTAGGSVVAALSIAAHMRLLPKALGAFRERFPSVRLRILEGTFPMHQGALVEGSIDFYIGPDPGSALPPELASSVLFRNTRAVIGRRGHPLAAAGSLCGLSEAEWATTSITQEAEAELGGIFRDHGLTAPRLALQSQSALTLMSALAASDMLAMVPIQWADFAPTAMSLQIIPVRETLPAPSIVVIARTALPLTPAAGFFADMLCRAAPLDHGR